MDLERRKRHFHRRWTAIVSWITGISIGSLALLCGGVIIGVAIFVRTETFQNSLRDRILQVARSELGISINYDSAQVEVFSLEPKIHFDKVLIEQPDQKGEVGIKRISVGISVFSLPLLAFRKLVLSSAELEGLDYEIKSTKIFNKWLTNIRPRSGIVPAAFQTSIQRVALSDVHFKVDLPEAELGHQIQGDIQISSLQVGLSSDEIQVSGLTQLKNFRIDAFGPYDASLSLDRAIQRGQRFNFRKLELIHGDDQLSLSGNVLGLKNPVLDIKGGIHFSIESFVPKSDVAGNFSSDFQFNGPWNELRGQGKFLLKAGHWRVKKLDEASADWEITPKLAKLSRLRWQDGEEKGSGNLLLSLTGDKKVTADLNVENSNLGSYLPLLTDGLRNWKGLVHGGIHYDGQIGEKFIGSFKGDLEVDGFEIRSFGSDTEILNVKKVKVSTSGEVKSMNTGVLNATADTGASQWTGSLEWGADKMRLAWDSKFNGQYFGDLFQYSISATGSLPGSYEGPWSHLVMRAMPQMKVFNFNGQDITNLTGVLKLEKRSLTGSPLKSDQLDLSGGIRFVEDGPDVFDNLEFSIRSGNFEKVLGFLHVTPSQSFNANGSLHAHGNLSGRVLLPTGSGLAVLSNWSFNNARQKGKSVKAKWACSRGDFYLQDVELTAMTDSDVVHGEATIDSKGFASISLQGPRTRLSDWSAVTETHFPFQSYMDFSLNYQRDVPALISRFKLTETNYEGTIYGDSDFTANWERDKIAAKGNIFGDSIKFEMNASETSAQREASIRAELKNANLGAFVPGLSTSRLEISSSGTATFKLSQPRDAAHNLLTGLLFEKLKVNGLVDVTEAVLRRSTSVYQEVKPFKIEIENSTRSGLTRFSTKQLQIDSGTKSLKLAGYFESLSDFRLDVDGATDLRSLAALVPTLSRTEGSLEMHGVWQPRGFTGGVEVANGLLTFQDSPLVIRDVEASVRATDSNFQLLRFTGNFREGSMSGSGPFRLREEGIVSANLQLKLDRILLQPLDGVSFRASGPLDLRVENNSGEVRGRLYITEGLFRRRVDLRSDLANFFKEDRRSFRPRDYEKAAWRQWKLAVGIQTVDQFTVRNNLGEGAANFNLTVRGTVGHPYLDGSLDIVRGQYTFNQKEFVIRSGSVLFKNGESNIPNYDIRSETEIGDYRVSTRLEGGPGNQKIRYSSDPPLNEKDILSLIQFGLPASAEEFKGQDTQRSISFSGLSFVTGGLQDKIETRLSRDLGIQRFQLSPSFFEETGKTELQLTLGTDLIKNRLSVNYSNYLSASGGHKLELDFKVNKNVSLIGSWRDVRLEQGKSGESNDDFGGDIRFRFEIE